MKKQSRSDALNSFGKGLVWIVGIVFIGLFAFNHTMKNDVMSSDIQEETHVQASEKDKDTDKIEKLELSLTDFEDPETQLTIDYTNSKFIIKDAYTEDDHLILVIEYTNLSNEPAEPLDAYRYFVDEVTQEDDNAIYDIDVNYFYDLMGDKEIEKISSGNPKIKSNGTFEFYVPYELHDDSEVTITFEGLDEPLKITLD